MYDPIIFVFVAVGSICLGFLLGFVVRGFTRRNSKPEETPETERKQKEKSTLKKAPNRNWSEVANLWRDIRNGQLIFQIEDQYYKRGDDLTNSERELLLKIVMDFYRWLEPPSAINNNLDGFDQPEPSTASLPTLSQQPNLPSQTSLEDFREDEQPSQKGLTPASFISRALRSDIAVPPPTSQSVVAQVDEILQEKLQATDMQKWAVRLVEFPNKGMTVLVGLEKYDNIDSVPYERVRAVIRESVSEWERRVEDGELEQ